MYLYWRAAVAFFQDNVTSVRTDQVLSVRKKRLVIFYRGMLLVFAICLIVYLSVVDAWGTVIVPRPYAVTFWADIPPEEDWEEWDRTDVPHCANPEAFAHEHGSRTYTPTGCSRRPPIQTWSKSEHQIFVPLFATDHFMTKGVGDRCTEAAEEGCESRGGFWSGEEGGGCACFVATERFERNAEMMIINFKHGFHTVLPDQVSGQPTTRGSNSVALNARGQEVPMITRFRDRKGTLCNIGGVTEHRDVDFYSASLAAWLRCAGVTDLDTPSGSMPALRVSGFTLMFAMVYNNVEERDQVICDITLEVDRVNTQSHWTTDVDLAVPLGSSLSEYEREDHGVRVTYKVSGAMRYFSTMALINNIVNVLFILFLPKQIVIFIILYGLGSTSVIYRHAIRTPFWIFGHIRSAVADMLAAKMAFHALTGGDFTLHERPGVLTQGRCLAHLKTLFAKELKNKSLEKRHLERMVHMLFEEVGESLDLYTFVKYASTNNPLAFHELVDILQTRQVRTTCLERLLDTTRAAEQALPDGEDFLGAEEVTAATPRERGSEMGITPSSPAMRSSWSEVPKKKPSKERVPVEEESAEEPDRQMTEQAMQGLAEALESKLNVLARQVDLANARRRAADERVALAEFVASQCLERLELAEQNLVQAQAKIAEAEARAKKCAQWAEVDAQEREQLTSTAQELRERLRSFS